MDFMDIINFVKERKIIFAWAGLGLILILIIKGGVDSYKNNLVQETEFNDYVYEEQAPVYINEDYQRLLDIQDSIIATNGKPPDGFMYNYDGTLLSIGDRNMTAEEAVYAYLQAITSLDMEIAQKYSRGSTVVNSYENFYNTHGVYEYENQFQRNMYRLGLMSIQLSGENTIVNFAENKQIVTVNAKMIDWTDHDFWREDEWEIYRYIYETGLEDDEAKENIYLYNYILNYFSGKNVKYRNVQFDLTLEKFQDVESGWLVSQDEDIDSACSYKDGKSIANYIEREYLDKGLPKFLDEEQEKIQKQIESEQERYEKEQQLKETENNLSDLEKINQSSENNSQNTTQETNNLNTVGIGVGANTNNSSGTNSQEIIVPVDTSSMGSTNNSNSDISNNSNNSSVPSPTDVIQDTGQTSVNMGSLPENNIVNNTQSNENLGTSPFSIDMEDSLN